MTPPPQTLEHRFVGYVPEELEERTLYVSMDYATVVHSCCCGCGGRVVTPLSPTDWKLTFDGRSVTLTPSVNNSGFECESHYFIVDSRVAWASRLLPHQLAATRRRDLQAKDAYYEGDHSDQAPVERSRPKKVWSWLAKLLSR
ncbi:MAG: DUF6527 family protein [Gammaproteobacteria bacterium]|nr:DUF6527 family protein [Gammaproteobacteria bacterium]